MKTGRNAPCPCGSGKKYKKCCINKNVTQPEALHYRRLSKALDQLMPKLIDHGHSVFGELTASAAMVEFFNWPDPGAEPDEAAIERAGTLFWPWLVFNWNYIRMEDEDGLLDGPEGTTIAELYLKNKRVDPQSLEAKLILATNRNPYSFLEIIDVTPGQSVRVRDVLTGAKIIVQERLGSETLNTGDILFGRTIQVGGAGMFLGLSAFVLPPRIKPQLIELRRHLSRVTTKVTRTILNELDLEIRDLYLEMDRVLHTPPEMRNTDNDPMEFHKLVYDIDSTDLAVEKLAPLSETQTVDEIRGRAEKLEDGNIRCATFAWDRMNNPMYKGMPNTVLGHIEIDGGQMTVSVNSAQRAQTIRKEIERRLGAAARFRVDEITDIDGMRERANRTTLPEDNLMDTPEIQQHIGRMLQTHWDNWVDEQIPALGYQTPKQAVRTADGREAVEALLLDAEKMAAGDPTRSALENELIANVRRRLKLDRPLPGRRGRPAPEQLFERVEQVKKLISQFGKKRLHDTYTGFALRLCDAIAGSDLLNIHRGRIEIWAAAIVYAIARLNFLFSSETPHHLTPDELCDWFKVKKQTVGNKASVIRTTLDLFYNDERFCAAHVTRIFQYQEDENGFIIPAAALEPEGHRMPEPLPLKPGAEAQKEQSNEPARSDKPIKTSGDRQLSLFED